MKKRFATVLFLAVSLLCIALAAFINLDRLPIRIWDESRLAVSAYEMYRDGWSLVTTYKGNPDLWNTKPPLLIWIQTLAMHWIGPNELAVRLPSAFAVFFTCAALFFFSKRIVGRYTLGFFSAFVLISCLGFNEFHTGRSGDYDALLTLWTTLASLSFFLAEKSRFKSRRWVLLFFVFLSLGVLTKSVAGLLFAPAYLIYALARGSLSAALKSRWTWWGLGVFAFMVLGFFLSREAAGPGYLQAVMDNDLVGRYSETLDGHRHSWKYYFLNFVDYRFAKFYLFTLGGLFSLFFLKKSPLRDLGFFSALLAVVYMTVISLGKTKLEWYDNPVFPFAALLAGVFLTLLAEVLAGALAKAGSTNKPQILSAGLLFLFFLSQPYFDMVNKNYKRNEYSWDVEYYARAAYLQKAVKGEVDLDGVVVPVDQYAAHEYFYVERLRDAGVQVGWEPFDQLKAGDKVLLGTSAQKHALNEIASETKIVADDSRDGVEIVQIISLKP